MEVLRSKGERNAKLRQLMAANSEAKAKALDEMETKIREDWKPVHSFLTTYRAKGETKIN